MSGDGIPVVTWEGEVRYGPKVTPELAAMGLIETAMTNNLCNAERWRIARWVADKWQQPPPPRNED